MCLDQRRKDRPSLWLVAAIPSVLSGVTAAVVGARALSGRGGSRHRKGHVDAQRSVVGVERQWLDSVSMESRFF